jgi:polysaccharide pyruvyl transferase WcaK-like protein
MLFNIGGDTYCYGKPYISYALNEMAMEKGIPTVFWGCSVEERLCKDAQMRRDVNRYSHIVARESLSYEILRQCVEDPGKVHLACDPAFTLGPEEIELPAGFIPGNTVGINISPLVCANEDNPDDCMYQNVFYLIDYILKTSDMGVCLIPHVYDPVHNTADSKVLGFIYSRYMEDPRVSLVNTVLNSRQLKYIISRCRFFVGARTHAMIAAYSSAVPALALSYSVKSLGIAEDLLGSAERYALPWGSLTRPEQLCEAFVSTLLENEAELRRRYGEVITGYRSTLLDTVKQIMK